MMLITGSSWCDRSPSCLATGTSFESGVTVTTRVRGRPDKPVLHTRVHKHTTTHTALPQLDVCASHVSCGKRGLEDPSVNSSGQR